MFGTATNEALPNKYLTDYAAWDRYMAHVWQPLLERFGAAQAKTIVEVAPGNSSKLGLALAELHFCGELFLVEPSAAGNYILAHYQALLPTAKVTLISKKLGDSLSDLPSRPGLLIANHPLDDMLLAVEASPESLAQLFDSSLAPTEIVSNQFRGRWTEISANIEHLDTIANAVYAEWLNAINIIKPSGILVSQYGSSALKNAHMDDLNASAKSILRRLQCAPLEDYLADAELQSLLNRNKHYSNHYIGTEVLDAHHWWAVRLLG